MTDVAGYQGAWFVLQGEVMLVGHPRFGFPIHGMELRLGVPNTDQTTLGCVL